MKGAEGAGPLTTEIFRHGGQLQLKAKGTARPDRKRPEQEDFYGERSAQPSTSSFAEGSTMSRLRGAGPEEGFPLALINQASIVKMSSTSRTAKASLLPPQARQSNSTSVS